MSAVVRTGIASYASLLPPTTDLPILPPSEPVASGSKKKKKWKPKAKRESPATSGKWADQCMYAELLEMSEENAWNEATDGLPDDLESGWVAVAPVPVGKRCLVVTDQSLGVPGVVPNTCLRSRKLGKLLLPRFPSTLPPLTVLQASPFFPATKLPIDYQSNSATASSTRTGATTGILHILDVQRWKGQDIGDCETPFRFWWRDTRPTATTNPQRQYHFPYPTRFLPIPYHTETTLSALVQIPQYLPEQGDMAVDQQTLTTEVSADGLLLYVAEATYEPGTSPLSSWIPLVNYDATYATEDREGAGDIAGPPPTDGPLDVFLRLVQRRLARGGVVGGSSVASMDVE
ncbi:hypothetical protein C8F01DRAFT_1163285 [Mycena amicta]|nr:hypothetical protein C8F01DRAFT_1163285 [Mycena amicta]